MFAPIDVFKSRDCIDGKGLKGGNREAASKNTLQTISWGKLRWERNNNATFGAVSIFGAEGLLLS